jgi:nicotinamide-nucleotide amidase
MWHDWVLPRLRSGDLGQDVAQVTYRLAGIGESVVAGILGEDFLRVLNPIVATYARQDAVDVRISAHGSEDRRAVDLVDEAAGIVRAKLADHIWATGETTWAEAIGTALADRGWTLATLEVGTGGALAHLLGSLPGLISAEVRAEAAGPLDGAARAIRSTSSVDVALVVRARPRAGDTAVSVMVVTPGGTHRESRLAFLGDEQGRHRAALAAADILLRRLRPA